MYAEEEIDLADEAAATDRAFFRHLLKTERLLPPLGSTYGPRRKRWCQLLLLFTTLEALYVPVMAAFRVPRDADGAFAFPPALAAVQWICDVSFWIDIVVMTRTTVQGDTSASIDVVTDTREIRRRYFRSTFPIDVRARVPISTARVPLAARAANFFSPSHPPLCSAALSCAAADRYTAS